jgi:hypothetical protein
MCVGSHLAVYRKCSSSRDLAQIGIEYDYCNCDFISYSRVGHSSERLHFFEELWDHELTSLQR